MKTGGVEWEQGAAVSGMVEAIRANDPDAMARAMADYAAALGTRTTNILSGLVTTVLLEIQDMRAERLSGARTMDHKLDLILDAHEAVRERLARVEENTLANVVSAEDRMLLIGLVRTIPQLAARVEALEQARDGE